MSRFDRRVLLALQILALAVPLLLGGRHPWTVPLAGPVVLALLGATLWARRQIGGGPELTGVTALAAFVLVALATTVPLPPFVLRAFSPATAELYAATLPGWPGSGEWSTWRTFAIDPYGVWTELGRLALAFGVFAVIVAYPWRSDVTGESGERVVLTRLVWTLVIGASAFAILALVAQIAGNGSVLWITGEPTQGGRASGPFVNPNHFAAWLEMIVPVALGCAVALGARLRRRLSAAAQAGRGMGVHARRAWIAALVANQRALALPLAAGTAVVVMLVAHLATDSRAGSAAMLIGLALAGTGMVTSMRRRTRLSAVPRWLPAAIAATLIVASIGIIGLWAASDSEDAGALASDVDVSLASRVVVAAKGTAIVRDHPLVGTGLGSWLHAFRPHQTPPVEGGIWDHAHNDYLELAAESGVAGTAAALAFAVATATTLYRQRRTRHETAQARRSRERGGGMLPPGFELPEWRAALQDRGPLRWGLAGGIAAVLVHSLMDFGLRMPGNLLTLLTVTALLLLASRPATAAPTDGGEPEALALPFTTVPAHSRALAALATALVLAAVVPTLDSAGMLVGASPISPRAALVQADLTLAEQGEDGRPTALALVRHALDWSPADREAHEAEAIALATDPAGDDALRRAIALAPWASDLRDALAERLTERGLVEEAAVELEESMRRFPYLVSHDYMSTTSWLTGRTPAEQLRALADGDTVPVRLAALDGVTALAIERGLTRALADTSPGTVRSGIVNDLAQLLESRGRHGDAAAMLRVEAERSQDGRAFLARAARNAIRARDLGTAETTLLAALADNPDQGRLYRELAVEVYAARGDFKDAETVLAAGERNALDMLPVHRGLTEFLARRAAVENAQVTGRAGTDSVVTEDLREP